MNGLNSVPLDLEREGLRSPITASQLSYITDDEILSQPPAIRDGLMKSLKTAPHWFYDEWDFAWINMANQK